MSCSGETQGMKNDSKAKRVKTKLKSDANYQTIVHPGRSHCRAGGGWLGVNASGGVNHSAGGSPTQWLLEGGKLYR